MIEEVRSIEGSRCPEYRKGSISRFINALTKEERDSIALVLIQAGIESGSFGLKDIWPLMQDGITWESLMEFYSESIDKVDYDNPCPSCGGRMSDPYWVTTVDGPHLTITLDNLYIFTTCDDCGATFTTEDKE